MISKTKHRLVKSYIILFWIAFQLFSIHVSAKAPTTIVPDTIILGTVSGTNVPWFGRFILSFDQNRFMPPGDQMYVERSTYNYFCGGYSWQKLLYGVHKINWYNDTINQEWTGFSNGIVNSSIQLYTDGCGNGSTVTFRIVYISFSGNQASASINNLHYDFAPTQLESITTNYSGNLCTVPLNVNFDVLMHCPECDGSSSTDMHYEINFGDGLDTFITALVQYPGNFHLVINHTYDAYGSFSPEFHVHNTQGGGYDTLSINVHPPPSAFITTSDPTTFCEGGNVTLSAPFNNNRTYQWKKGGIDIPGATSSDYTTSIGGVYKVTVTNTITGCSKTSTNGTLVTVNPLPQATITPLGPTTFCAGGNVVLKANSGSGLIYKWKKDGSFIGGATAINYTAFVPGTYKVQVTNNNGCKKTSQGTIVTVPCREEENLIETNIELSIFPNPTSGKFTIHSVNEKINQINITNLSGQIIYKKEFLSSPSGVRGFEIDLSNQAKGIYLIQVITDQQAVNQKIIVN
jgi:hypothetical protein